MTGDTPIGSPPSRPPRASTSAAITWWDGVGWGALRQAARTWTFPITLYIQLCYHSIKKIDHFTFEPLIRIISPFS